MRPGITVAPAASMTVSASPSRPRPTAAITPSWIATVSPSSSGCATSPDTICPMFTMSVFTEPSERGCSHGQVGAAKRLVGEQIAHRPAEPDHAALDDIGAVGEPGRELHILLRQHDGEALALERGDLLPERSDDDRRQPLRRL